MCSGQIITSPSSRGPALGAGSVEREREDVGRLVPIAVLAVELADPLLADELDREVAVGDAGRLERRRGCLRELGRDVREVDAHPFSSARRSSRSRVRSERPGALAVLAVGGDDPLHEPVADDVVAAEADEADVVDRREDLADDDEAGPLVGRQVDLGDVAGDDHLRAEAEPGQEHLHLLGARVLGLVEDHEGVIQGAAAHERQRRDLDDAALEVVVDAVGIEHVVEGVEERPQVGIDLGLDVAGQEPEPLPGLDGGAGEDHRLTSRDSSAATAIATARKVLPVPAGPIPKVTVCSRIEST